MIIELTDNPEVARVLRGRFVVAHLSLEDVERLETQAANIAHAMRYIRKVSQIIAEVKREKEAGTTRPGFLARIDRKVAGG